METPKGMTSKRWVQVFRGEHWRIIRERGKNMRTMNGETNVLPRWTELRRLLTSRIFSLPLVEIKPSKCLSDVCLRCQRTRKSSKAFRSSEKGRVTQLPARFLFHILRIIFSHKVQSFTQAVLLNATSTRPPPSHHLSKFFASHHINNKLSQRPGILAATVTQ